MKVVAGMFWVIPMNRTINKKNDVIKKLNNSYVKKQLSMSNNSCRNFHYRMLSEDKYPLLSQNILLQSNRHVDTNEMSLYCSMSHFYFTR